MKRLSVLLFLNAIVCLLFAQETFPVNGTPDKRPERFLLIHARIVPDYKSVPFKGSMLIENGKIKKIANGVIEEKGAALIDVKDNYIYPSFIDLYAQYGIAPNTPKSNNGYPQFLSDKQGAYDWNEAIRAEYNAYESFKSDTKQAQSYLENGFGALLTHNMDGIVRGSGALVSLSTHKKEQEIFIQPQAAGYYSFDKGSSQQDYPNSLMGSIALLRQTYYDAQWYMTQKKEFNITLDAFNKLLQMPKFFNTSDWQDVFRAKKIADEFKLNYIYVGNGDEYQCAAELKNLNIPFVIPVVLPLPFDAEDPYTAADLSWQQLAHWEDAPYNLAFLEKQKIDFALTSYGLKNSKDFFKNLSKYIKYGSSKEEILKALTYTPAKLIGADSMLGTLAVGKYANFILTNKPVFDDGFSILQNWTQGEQHIINPFTDSIYEKYILTYGNRKDTLTINKSTSKNEASVKADSTQQKLNVSIAENQISFSFDNIDKNNKGTIRFLGWKSNDGFSGNALMPDGKSITWIAKPFSFTAQKDTSLTKTDTAKKQLPTIVFPFNAYGYTKLPEAKKIIFKHATVWTNEAEGILKNMDVAVENGKITYIGNQADENNAIVIDATGKHLTSGIIDEHSHICISGNVNECSQSSTAEVRIGDVVNSNDINMYRQLAGGVVAAQLLHGSCNPIGGQSALIKLRWGNMPEDLKIKNADGFIKFALGENVKQSNWGEKQNQRFPQTRMGVEQVYMDYFTRASSYLQKKNVRKDLELDAIAEILNKKRFISCHSYVQSEINMLMNVADKFKFKVNTFTHILEGYKVADKMKKHGAGASTFADWWAYKLEVMEAIPWNAAVLQKMGIVTAINSDDAEMGRRLNQEAAKAVKYGGISEEEAWKMVTLNPAKLLHLDKNMGSIKVGKDADLVLWSDNPLSIYAKAEQTYIDGKKYFDITEEDKMQDQIRKEKARILQNMLQAKKDGAETQPATQYLQENYHCDDSGIYHERQK